MALLGWVPAPEGEPLPDLRQPRFVHNASGRFESRWAMVQVRVPPSCLVIRVKRGDEGPRMTCALRLDHYGKRDERSV
eukprot:365185-Chlamydomonas_euryale.AAC.4